MPLFDVISYTDTVEHSSSDQCAYNTRQHHINNNNNSEINRILFGHVLKRKLHPFRHFHKQQVYNNIFVSKCYVLLFCSYLSQLSPDNPYKHLEFHYDNQNNTITDRMYDRIRENNYQMDFINRPPPVVVNNDNEVRGVC